jgi:hypothetical protein
MIAPAEGVAFAAIAAGNKEDVDLAVAGARLAPLRLAELAAETGFPEGGLNIVPGLGEEAEASRNPATARKGSRRPARFPGAEDAGVQARLSRRAVKSPCAC